VLPDLNKVSWNGKRKGSAKEKRGHITNHTPTTGSGSFILSWTHQSAKQESASEGKKAKKSHDSSYHIFLPFIAPMTS
jgi:hypothetical protein